MLALALAAAALLSDRAPKLVVRAQDRFERPWWFPWPIDDSMFHISTWFVITLLAVVAVRSLRARLLVAAGTAVAGPVLEYLQLRLTATRAFEAADIIANTRGVYLGLAAGLLVGAVLDRLEASQSAGTAREGP